MRAFIDEMFIAQAGIGRLMRVALRLAAVLAPLFLTGFMSSASPSIAASGVTSQEPKSVRIAGDRGGYVIKYAAQMMRWREEGTKVRFSGHCESACTLYLALPLDQICVTPNAAFRFHAPMAEGRRSQRQAERFMLASYPGWVRSWIRKRGGLSTRMISMDYNYARKFIRGCAPAMRSA